MPRTLRHEASTSPVEDQGRIGPALEKPDTRRDYGEARVIAVGAADGFMLTVVYTDRSGPDGLERRLISARRSNRRERKAYQARPQS